MEEEPEVRAAIYARISRANENDSLGVERQATLCRQLAAERGWEVVGEFSDNGRSAYTRGLRRDGYERLLDTIASKKVDVVLTYHVDRLFRQDKERLRFYEVCTQAGVHLIAAVDGSDVDLRSADGRKQFRDLGSAAEYASDRQSERLRRKHDEIAASGGWQGGGRRPFGYVVEGGRATTGQPATLKVHEAEAKLLRAAARHVLSGGSMYSVARRWNERGFLTPTGKLWGVNDIRRILLSPQAAGLRVHGRWVSDLDGGNRRREVLGVTEGTWPAILTREEHELLKAKLDGPGRGVKTGTPIGRKYLLTGLARCGGCGQPLTGRRRKTKRFSYTCPGAMRGCTGTSIVGPPLDDAVLAVAGAVWNAQPDEASSETTMSEDQAAVLGELRVLEDRRDAVARDYADGQIDARQLQVATARLDERTRELEAKLAQVVEPRRRSFGEVFEQAMEFTDRVTKGELTPAEAAETHDYIKGVIEQVVIDKARRPGIRYDPDRVSIVLRQGVTPPVLLAIHPVDAEVVPLPRIMVRSEGPGAGAHTESVEASWAEVGAVTWEEVGDDARSELLRLRTRDRRGDPSAPDRGRRRGHRVRGALPPGDGEPEARGAGAGGARLPRVPSVDRARGVRASKALTAWSFADRKTTGAPQGLTALR
jgi:site-specific DNA recombinase